MKKNFDSLKRASNASYIIALVLTAFALFRYAHIHQLTPGFELMLFTMKFFAGIFLLSTSIFFLLFLLKKSLEKKK